MYGSRWAVRPVRTSMVAGSAALLAVLAACAEPPKVSELLTDACAQARDSIAGAPAPADDDSEERFVEMTRAAAKGAARVARDVSGRGDDATIADMAWQLDRFPASAAHGRSLVMAQEAAAAITRLDEFADRLQIPECGAETWRPEVWRAIADRHADRLPHRAFRRRLDRLCAKTFPDPSLLADGVPLLDALVADANPRGAQGDASERTTTQLIARLHTLGNRPSHTARFLRDFSAALPQSRPPEELEDEYLALMAAFIDVQSAVPRAMPREPPPAVRERVGAALDELQRTWDTLDITCRA